MLKDAVELIYSNYLFRIGLKSTNDVHVNSCLKSEFSHSESEKKDTRILNIEI